MVLKIQELFCSNDKKNKDLKNVSYGVFENCSTYINTGGIADQSSIFLTVFEETQETKTQCKYHVA